MQRVALGELFHVRSSKRVLKSQWKSSGVPFYRGREITRLAADGLVDNELFISENDYAKYAAKHGVPSPGDIVITAIGTIGNAYIVREGDRFYFKDASVLWLKKDAVVSSEFINLWLKSQQFYDQLDKGNGATVDTLTIKKLQSVLVELPPLPEQKRIVAILDEAFAAIATATANAEKNLANARELFTSKLHQVYGFPKSTWREVLLSELADHSLGKMLDKKKNRGTAKKYLRNLNVRWFDFDLSDLLEMRFESSEQDKYTVRYGDLLICEGGYPGRAAIWESSEDIHFQKAIHRVRFHDPRHTKWFLYYLYYMDVTGSIKKYFTGAGIQHFTGKALAQVRVPVPSSGEIDEYVEGFDLGRRASVDLSGIHQQKMHLLSDLKQSVLHKAFTGELTANAKTADRALSEAGV